MSRIQVTSTLPKGWQHDDWYREEIIYPQIRALDRQGFYWSEIAGRVGCSDKTVERVLARAA